VGRLTTTPQGPIPCEGGPAGSVTFARGVDRSGAAAGPEPADGGIANNVAPDRDQVARHCCVRGPAAAIADTGQCVSATPNPTCDRQMMTDRYDKSSSGTGDDGGRPFGGRVTIAFQAPVRATQVTHCCASMSLSADVTASAYFVAT